MKIGLFIDDMDMEDAGMGRAGEISEIKKQFKDLKPDYVEDTTIGAKMLDGGFDLCVVDYGGLSAMPGNSLGEHFARYVNEYAENHPNTLIVYVTVMGAHFLEGEGLNMDELHNIKWCNRIDVRTLWDKWNGEATQKKKGKVR